MDIADLEIWGAEIAKWSADYLQTLRERPVRAQTKPGQITAAIPPNPPRRGVEFEQIFAEFSETILPGITHWQHPRFFAYFPANSSPPSVLAEWITTTLAAQCMLWQTSPAATELETVTIDWLRQMIGLPEGFSGVIQDSASSATLCAILTMRERALDWAGNRAGLSGQPVLRVYSSEQVHSSIEKACFIAGIGRDNLIKIPSQGDLYGINPAALAQAVKSDRDNGLIPAGIIAGIGGTSIGGCDDITAVAAIAKSENLFLHVDAAWAGSAMICPEYRSLMAGAELADSFVFNPHKWLFTNFDCSAYFIRDPEALVKTLGLRPAYLETMTHQSAVTDYSEWSVPLGRRFRALKLWFVIRSYGIEKLQTMIRNHITMAHGLAARLEAEADFEVTSTPILALFSFRHRPEGTGDLNAHNARLLQTINDDGTIYLTQTLLDDKFVIRFQVGQTYTQQADVDLAFDTITRLARSLA